MDVSEVRRVSRRRDLTESADPAQCGGHSCAFLKGDSHAALSGSDDDREQSGDRITLLRLYVENATQWNLDRQGTRAVTIQIDAPSSTACSLAKGARASRIKLAAAARTSGGCSSSARAAGPISSAPSTAASRPRPTAISSERLHGLRGWAPVLAESGAAGRAYVLLLRWGGRFPKQGGG